MLRRRSLALRRQSLALRRWSLALRRWAGVLLWHRTRCLPWRCRLLMLLRRTTLVIAVLVPPVGAAPWIAVVILVGP